MFVAQFILYHLSMLIVMLGLFWFMVQKPLTVSRLLRFGLYGFLGSACFFTLLIGKTVQLRAIGQRFAESLFFESAVFLLLCLFVPKKKPSRIWTFSLICLSVTFVTIGIFSLYIEPQRVTVAHYEMISEKINDPVRIVFLCDLQTDNDPGEYERYVLKKAQSLEPDLLLFGGDYMQPGHEKATHAATLLNEILRDCHLSAPLGVYAVLGNHDWNRSEALFNLLFQKTSIQLIPQHFSKTVQKGSTEIQLTFLSLGDSCIANQKQFSLSDEQFHIMLGHNPSFAGGEMDADLALAGHTHGGQVCIPGFGPLITFAHGIPRSWGKGRTQINDHQTLIVSNGIGLERGFAPRIRFFCPPEIVVIDLYPNLGPNNPNDRKDRNKR